jgi:hypothetical protein
MPGPRDRAPHCAPGDRNQSSPGLPQFGGQAYVGMAQLLPPSGHPAISAALTSTSPSPPGLCPRDPQPMKAVLLDALNASAIRYNDQYSSFRHRFTYTILTFYNMV